MLTVQSFVVCAFLQLGTAGDKGGADITVSSNESITGEYYNIGTLTISGGATVTCTGAVIIRAKRIVIDGTISADGANASTSTGNGGDGAGSGKSGGGGGAGHGGAGGAGGAATGGAGGTAGSTYSTSSNPSFTVPSSPDSADDMDPPGQLEDINEGSDGGDGGNSPSGTGGTGGGRVILYASISINISGNLSANGATGGNGDSNKGGGGGGSGGGIVIAAPSVTISGTVSANGGNGGSGGSSGLGGGGGGGGGGGRIKIFYDSLSQTGTVRASGGTGGTASGSAAAGDNGSAGAVSSTAINFRPSNGATLSIQSAQTEGSSIYSSDSTPTFNLSGFTDPNTNTNPTTWGAHAATRWQIRTQAGSYSSPLADTGYDSSNKTSYTASTLSDGVYYIRVQYVDSGSTSGYGGSSSAPSAADYELASPFSSEQIFYIDMTSPSMPSPQSPVNGASTGTSVTLTWSSSTDATSGVKQYEVVIMDGDGNTLSTTTTTSTSLSTTLTSGNYRWKVRAIDRAGNNSSYSSDETFSVSSETKTGNDSQPVQIASDSAHPRAVLVSPKNSVLLERSADFVWLFDESNVSLSYFELVVSERSTGNVVYSGRTASKFHTVDHMPKGEFTWFVKAVFSDDTFTQSETADFITVFGLESTSGARCSASVTPSHPSGGIGDNVFVSLLAAVLSAVIAKTGVVRRNYSRSM